MLSSISAMLARIKVCWAHEFTDDVLTELFLSVGCTWRDRLLTPIVTVRLFLVQVLHGNTACSALPHLSGLDFTDQAYCEARKRLPLAALEAMLARTTERLAGSSLDSLRWLGHRVFLVDGSSFSMPDKRPLQREFGQPGGQQPGCGFPVAHWLAMMHQGTGLIVKMLTAPLRTHDMSRAAELHPELQAGDVLVGDRAFCSYVHLALLFQRAAHGLFRIHQKQIVDFTPGRTHLPPGQSRKNRPKGLPTSRWLQALGFQDQLVEWFKPVNLPDWVSAEQFAALPEKLLLRELRYRVNRSGFRVREVTVVTTLVDSTLYPATELAELYGRRWNIETNFRHLKTTMGMDVLRCESVDGVLKELTMFALAYNLVRLAMAEAARRQGVPVERISFVDALRWFTFASAETSLSWLNVNPLRPDRVEPRVLKRRMKEYTLLKKPRRQLREELKRQLLAA
jgi:hypothetical protein